MDPKDAFHTLELRVGRIVKAEHHTAARKPAYVLSIDFGSAGLKTSSAQLTELYSPDDLVGRLVVAATNLGVRRIAGIESEVLVLGVPDEAGRVVLLTPERDSRLAEEYFSPSRQLGAPIKTPFRYPVRGSPHYRTLDRH